MNKTLLPFLSIFPYTTAGGILLALIATARGGDFWSELLSSYQRWYFTIEGGDHATNLSSPSRPSPAGP